MNFEIPKKDINNIEEAKFVEINEKVKNLATLIKNHKQMVLTGDDPEIKMVRQEINKLPPEDRKPGLLFDAALDKQGKNVPEQSLRIKYLDKNSSVATATVPFGEVAEWQNTLLNEDNYTIGADNMGKAQEIIGTTLNKLKFRGSLELLPFLQAEQVIGKKLEEDKKLSIWGALRKAEAAKQKRLEKEKETNEFNL